MNSSIVIALPKIDDAKKIRTILNRHGFSVAAVCSTASTALASMSELDGGILICGYKLTDRYYRDVLEDIPSYFEMLLLASGRVIAEAPTSVLTVEMPMKVSDLVNTVDMISDETAYRRYLDGEQKAADLLVERYGDALTLYINGYIKDIHEAEDLMIEAFSQLFAKERPIEGVGSFKAYLYKTARHLALRHKQKHRLAFLCLDELDFEPQSNTLIDTDLLRSERDRQLYDALEKLKAEYREALYLVYFEDMSYRDAATVMNKSESQITKLIYRGKQSLKVILEQEGFTYADK